VVYNAAATGQRDCLGEGAVVLVREAEVTVDAQLDINNGVLSDGLSNQ
jgi:hypothetical protein